MKEDISLSITIPPSNDATIEKTFQKEKKRLLGFIKKRVSDNDDAEDILQDVFYQFIQSFTALEPIEKISSWLFRVAKNKIIDKYRKKKPDNFSKYDNQSGPDSSLNLLNFIYDAKQNTDQVYLRSLVWDALSQALDELPENQKLVFVWHEIEGRDFKEISAMTGDPVNTLISRKRYAVVHLREQLQHLYNDIIKN